MKIGFTTQLPTNIRTKADQIKAEATQKGYDTFETRLGVGDAHGVDTKARYYAVCNGMQSMRSEAAQLRAPGSNEVRTDNVQAAFDEKGDLTRFEKKDGDKTQLFEKTDGVMTYASFGERGGSALIASAEPGVYEGMLISSYKR